MSKQRLEQARASGVPADLAIVFESGLSRGCPGTIGTYGGYASYGSYQIDSKTGPLKSFVNFLRISQDPEIKSWGERLASKSDPTNPHGAFASEWRKIANENPKKFARVQDQFAKIEYWDPSVKLISRRTGLGYRDIPHAVGAALFSAAIQHGVGRAVDMFVSAYKLVSENQAYKNPDGKGLNIQGWNEFLETFYRIRTEKFSSMKGRYMMEMKAAKALLNNQR